jgi:hypothetical protein
MSAKLPPVPPDNRSHKGVGDKAHPTAGEEAAAKSKVEKPGQQGQQGNIKQNTTHQGYQQDR